MNDDNFDRMLDDSGRGPGSSDAGGNQGQGKTDRVRDDEIRTELAKVAESGFFTIALIGFATSGKTFFLNRLKRQYRLTTNPETAATYSADPREPDGGEKVEGTPDVSVHFFKADIAEGVASKLRAMGKEPVPEESFWIIDVPGEQFRGTLKRLGQDSGRDEGKIENLKQVMRIANALIIVVASDELLAPLITADDRDAFEEKEEKLAELDGELADSPSSGRQAWRTRLAGENAKLKRRIDLHDRLDELILGIGDISRQAKGAGGDTPLTFIALSKADTLQARGKSAKAQKEFADRIAREFPSIADCERIDCDPANLVRMYRPDFHDLVADHFPWYKFDFVTAFEGQPIKPPRNVKIDYTRRHFGVLAIIRWIEWVRDNVAHENAETQDRQPGFPTRIGRWRDRTEARLALRLRKARDGAVALDPSAVGLDPAAASRPRRSWLDGWTRLKGWNADRMLRKPGSRFANATILFVMLMAGWAALNIRVPDRPQSQPRFDLKPSYRAEFDRLRRDLPWRPEDLLGDGVNPWLRVPDDGGWFAPPNGSVAQVALSAAIRSASASADRQAQLSEADNTVADQLEAASNAAAADAHALKSVLAYHRGVLFDRAGVVDKALAAFKTAADEARMIVTETAMTPPYQNTRGRVAVMRLETLNAYGRAALRNGDSVTALQALKEAKALMGASRRAAGLDAIQADPGQYWYRAVSPERRAVFNFDTADIWANLIAAATASYANYATNSEQADLAYETLSELVNDPQYVAHIDQLTAHPKLATDLQLAELVVHPLNAHEIAAAATNDDTGRFTVFAHNIAGVEQGYWNVVRKWRSSQFSRLPDDGGPPNRSINCNQIDKDLQTVPADDRDLRAWLAEVLEAQSRAQPSEQAALTSCYGSYYSSTQLANKYFRFGVWAAIFWLVVLIAIFVLMLYWATRMMPRIRAICDDMSTPRHRPQRLGDDGNADARK